MNNSILIESGTNELEIVLFSLNKEVYGVNVSKVESIIKSVPVTSVPNSSPNIKGLFNHRGSVLPVLNLYSALKLDYSQNDDRLFIIISINNSKFAVEVDDVLGISRLSWGEIEKPPSIIGGGKESIITGIVKLEKYGIVLMLDFEKLLAETDSSLNIYASSIDSGLEGKHIVIVEDSQFLLEVIRDSLVRAGAKVNHFENGQLALNFLEKVNAENIYCVVTDIEMPVMDGLTLTKSIKTSKKLEDIPVIIFSSIISDDLKHKGESVGADAQITKPEINRLIEIVKGIRRSP